MRYEGDRINDLEFGESRKLVSANLLSPTFSPTGNSRATKVSTDPATRFAP
jgi:hypothetical protein